MSRATGQRRELRLLAVYSTLEDDWKPLQKLAGFYRAEFRLAFQCPACHWPLVQAWTAGGPVGPMLPPMRPAWAVFGW